MHVPTVTVRRTTERPETVDCGSNIVSGERRPDPWSGQIDDSIESRLEVPDGYLADNVSRTVVKYVLGGKVNVH